MIDKLTKIKYSLIYMILELAIIKMIVTIESSCQTGVPGTYHWTDDYFEYLEHVKTKLKQ